MMRSRGSHEETVTRATAKVFIAVLAQGYYQRRPHIVFVDVHHRTESARWQFRQEFGITEQPVTADNGSNC